MGKRRSCVDREARERAVAFTPRCHTAPKEAPHRVPTATSRRLATNAGTWQTHGLGSYTVTKYIEKPGGSEELLYNGSILFEYHFSEDPLDEDVNSDERIRNLLGEECR
jgi:hypothetical protein